MTEERLPCSTPACSPAIWRACFLTSARRRFGDNGGSLVMSASLQRKLVLAQDRLRAGDAAGAQAACKDVLARAPRNPEALYLTGVSCILAGNPAMAVRVLHEALAIRPSHGP